MALDAKAGGGSRRLVLVQALLPAQHQGKLMPKPTKTDLLKELLAQEHGYTTAALSELLEWQPHTTRAALSRLRSAGLDVEKLPPAVNCRAPRFRTSGGQK